ncbi:hypothetical protein E1N52_38420 [Paraburkholderia guartelaensis]|uniref:Uncharacterized protein n=1 Tax=Paraburkholderia guartelaensis TaxID=2546446 RepID=A0A4R5L287_9BURK|nr:TnsA endonuclease N-terminal domain-containing protein [Paraburkholderia guartelaensis]TDG02682.1 hypothetical protein E1N52_38420 [Paraburkholderia guartelaensis]
MSDLTTRQKRLVKIRQKGLGTGTGQAYVPGKTVWGDRWAKRVHRIPFMGREAHIANDSRYAEFLWETYQDDTVDIRESYVCDPELTLRIAGAMHIPHPRYDDGSEAILYTDFLVSKRLEGKLCFVAKSVRRRRDEPPAMTNELRIVEQYWIRQGIPWSLVLNDGMNENWALNLDRLYLIALRPDRAGEGAMDPNIQQTILDALSWDTDATVSEVCAHVMRRRQQPFHFGLNAYHLLLAARHIRFNLDCGNFDHEPVSSLRIVDSQVVPLQAPR